MKWGAQSFEFAGQFPVAKANYWLRTNPVFSIPVDKECGRSSCTRQTAPLPIRCNFEP